MRCRSTSGHCRPFPTTTRQRCSLRFALPLQPSESRKLNGNQMCIGNRIFCFGERGPCVATFSVFSREVESTHLLPVAMAVAADPPITRCPSGVALARGPRTSRTQAHEPARTPIREVTAPGLPCTVVGAWSSLLTRRCPADVPGLQTQTCFVSFGGTRARHTAHGTTRFRRLLFRTKLPPQRKPCMALGATGQLCYIDAASSRSRRSE